MKAFVQHSGADSDKMVLQSLVPFMMLNKIALFTQKALSNDIDSDTNLLGVEANAEYYQRRLDPKRLRDIKKYIYNAILDEKDNLAVSALFPTAMILAIELENLPIIEENMVDFKLESYAKMYIVDGQHRLMAMRQLYEELNNLLIKDDDEKYIINYLEHYSFNSTILVNFDIWEQGQVFINVNFRQKPVNRSLYYDVFGAEYIEGDNPKLLERNKIYIAHELTRFMNETTGSPFYKKIKMLGTGKGYISQAFFVESLLPLFKPTGVWYLDTMPQSKSENVFNAYKSELFNFFLVVSRSFEKYWGENEEGKIHFICKTTGVGAFTRLMAIIHRNIANIILEELNLTKPGEECKSYTVAIYDYLAPIVEKQDYFFGKDSKFAGTGGRGLEMSLLKEMRDLLYERGLIKANDKYELPYSNSLFQLKKKISDEQIVELEKRGITNLDNKLLVYMNNHLPSEVDALGSHCRIEDVSDVIISSSDIVSDVELKISGTLSTKVEVMLDNEDSSCFSYVFPATFTAMFRNDGEWILNEEDTKVYVNTDKYYI